MDDPVPKVSIIIPAYNHAAWIEEALESVFRQSLDDWELIIIDDASSDQSWSLIQEIITSRQSPDLKASATTQAITTIQHSSNQGAPATLNEGLAMARGEYLAILNSDDVWDCQRLERLYRYAEQTDLDFVATSVKLWDKHSRLKNATESDWLDWYRGLHADWKKQGDFLHTLLLSNFLITTSNFFFRRSVYERLGGFSELRYVHDYEYALRMYNAGTRMDCLWEEPLLNYRLHGSNTIREKPRAAIQENTRLLLKMLPALSRHLNASRLHAFQVQLTHLYHYNAIEWKTEIHRCLVAKEAELFPLIADRDGWVAERDTQIKAQQQLIQERDEWVAQRDGWIAERDALVKRLQDDVNRHQLWIEERESWLTDRDEMISKRDQWVMERDSWVAERDQWVAERDQLISHLQLENQQLLDSWSYRLGSYLLNPLRVFRRRVKARRWRAEHA